MPQQHPEDLPVRMVCRVEQSLLLKILQNELADIEAEPAIHCPEAALLEIMQSHVIDDAVER